MEVLGVINAFLLLFGLIAVYFLIIGEDLVLTVRYFNSHIVSGTITEYCGKVPVKTTIIRRRCRYRDYAEYVVRYNYHGEWLECKVLSETFGLQPGDSFDVHIDDMHYEHRVIDEQYWNRMKVRLFMVGLAVLYIVGTIVFENNRY